MPRWLGAAIATTSLVVGLGLAEVVVRVADGGAFTQLDLYEQRGDGTIRLTAGKRTLRRPGGGTYTVRLGSGGVRVTGEPRAPRQWLVLGDSQVLGLGVEDDEVFAARAAEPAVRRLQPNAVPGWGVEDALGSVDLGRAGGALVVVNQANDWDEAGRPIAERYEVHGGWLLPKGVTGWRAAFFDSPLSRAHLLHQAVVALSTPAAPEPPIWARDPAATAAATARIGAAIRAYADAHPGVDVVVAYLPLDAATSPDRARVSPFAPLLGGRPVPSLASDLARALQGLPLVDLTDALRDPGCWLDGDYHLSPEGHDAVARALGPALDRATSGGAAP